MRAGIEVKLLPQEGELYIFAQSRDRINKERAMRRRALRKLLTRLAQLQTMELKRDQLLLKLGEAKAAAGRAYYLVDLRLPAAREPVNAQTFSFKLNRAKLRVARRREGRYLLRSNLCEELPVKLWELYMQLTQVEEAFKNLKGDPFGFAQGRLWRSGPSTISAKRGSRRTSSSPSSPTACKSP